MPLTREFKETVQARLRADGKYRKELLREGVECLLGGDLDTGTAVGESTRGWPLRLENGAALRPDEDGPSVRLVPPSLRTCEARSPIAARPISALAGADECGTWREVVTTTRQTPAARLGGLS